MRELLGGLVPGLPEPAVEAIVARADGMPLYAVEMVRSLVADGRLGARTAPSCGRSATSTDLAVPETLPLARRGPARRARPRRPGAPPGRGGPRASFTPPALAAVRGVERRRPRAAPRRARPTRAVRARGTDPRSPERGQYRFVQSLIREVAYDTLARRDRRARHLAAARYFESARRQELAGALAEPLPGGPRRRAPPARRRDAVAAQARLALACRGRSRRSPWAHPTRRSARLEQALRITAEGPARLDLLDRASDAAVVGAHYEKAEEHARAAVAGRAGTADRVAAARSTNRLASAEPRRRPGADRAGHPRRGAGPAAPGPMRPRPPSARR